jgi:hypothetical protein
MIFWCCSNLNNLCTEIEIFTGTEGVTGSINRNSTVVVASLSLKSSIRNSITLKFNIFELKSKVFWCSYKSSFMKC